MMLTPSLKRWIFLFLCCSVAVSPAAAGANAQSLKDQYDSLSPKGKFAVGAGVGYVGAKVVVGSAVKAIKVAGAAFIASEVMNAAGVFKDIDLPDSVDNVLDDAKPFMDIAKKRTLVAINDLRTTVRRKINPAKLRYNLEEALVKERMATLGAATGAFVGLAL
mmetsp:Transcript_11484/g.27083  ORF Transcript_11484/g.27083 Transcript_11484/m.27083 type:complete len:163 (-) Transcript_11484:191-679(-)|eukprot:CAMPEP_0185801192 /NCGR_PEP_ID=MMETSP1322-20130828/1307_1 /TAXON_ID=265543 /ORGANISM="Minutocellus polymorphus, Strain RCC2270" /LENGTH=162 /DNA_ID=CAMNT_0028496881 /DNA_START=191 /DNA_END=679 /DNA_ORIENTATION=-